MKILLDMSTPQPLGGRLKSHRVTHCSELGWHTLNDLALLNVAERHGFDLLITCDQNVAYQQNLHGRRLAILILSTNHWPTLEVVAAKIATKVDFIQAGTLVRLNIREL